MRLIAIVTFVGEAIICSPGLAQIPQDASAIAYRAFTCPQILQEGRAIAKRGFAASGLKAVNIGTDATDLAPAVIVVWPVKTITDKQQSDKVALAMDQMNTLEQASISSQCSIRFQRPLP